MALPYKLLKTITIDGEEMGVDTTVGTAIANSATVNVPGNMSSWTAGPTVTLDAKSFYLVQMGAAFKVASTTGATWHNFSLSVNGSRAFYDTLLHSSQEAQDRNTCIGIVTGANDTPIELAAQSNRAMTGVYLAIYAYKLPSYQTT